MRTLQEVTRAISVRWIIKTIIRMSLYCLNPFRLIKWLIYLVLGTVFLGMLTLAAGNYARAAEWAPAAKETIQTGDCQKLNNGMPQVTVPNSTLATCLAQGKIWDSSAAQYPTRWNALGTAGTLFDLQVTVGGNWYGTNTRFSATGSSDKYSCPPAGKPDFTMGPIVNDKGTICEKKPVECLTGSIKEVNAITGKEFCRPLCSGIAGNSLSNVSYFQSQFGSVQIQCYGQCSIISAGVSVSTGGAPNIYTGDVKFTGENCPVQTNGEVDNVDQSGTVQAPSSSDATNAAQNQLQNAASSATSNTVSGATGTANLNTVVDKIAQASNAEIKASSEQNAALGKVIQNTGKDIQASIKEAQLSASQGGAGASLGQIQTANAIKDGNAQLGGKLDAIKDAIEAGNEDGEEEEGPTLPPGDTDIKVDPSDVNPNPNDWSTRNYGSVMQHHVTAMNELPLFSSLSGFFEVNMGAGSCPTFTFDLPELGGFGGNAIVIDLFCSADFQSLFVIIALCVKLLGLYSGCRIALLD